MPGRNRRPGFGQGRGLRGSGLEDGKQEGLKSGGRGLNQTDNCRNPEIKKKRK